MGRAKAQKLLDSYRGHIGRRVRELRKNRLWTQVELAGRLAISQTQLSEIEHGARSLTAEQLLLLLQLFNASVGDFDPSPVASDDGGLQNALASFGAAHLQEREDVLRDRALEDVTEVCRAAIVSGEPRLVTAVAPVLVRNIETINLRKLEMKLLDQGLGQRLGWLLENVYEALDRETLPPTSSWAKAYKRARIVLHEFLRTIADRRFSGNPDLLDSRIRSDKTLKVVSEASTVIAKRWRVVTGITVEDFIQALRAARDDD